METTEQIPWIENDELARELAYQGWLWQRFVAAFFEARGLPVELPPFSWRKSREQIKDYFHSWDMKVCGQRIEVKSRDLVFHSDRGMTFPEPYPFVDTVRKWDAHDPKPMAYVIVSQHTGAMLTTPGSVEAKEAWWGTFKGFDSVRRIPEEWYTIDRRLLDPIERAENHPKYHRTLMSRLRALA